MDLIQLLSKKGELSLSTVAIIERFKKKWDVSSYMAVLECNIFTEQQLSDFISRVLNLEKIEEIGNRNIPYDAFERIPFSKASKWEVLPMGYSEKGDEFKVLMADPTNQKIIDELSKLLNCDLKIFVGERRYIHQLINDCYPLKLQVPGLAGV
ncbi:MAG: hypothetical protein HQK54_03250 [Oligoflexales bacterium]|nr:hypothetical protein [Oligoflexales bacterium]